MITASTSSSVSPSPSIAQPYISRWESYFSRFTAGRNMPLMITPAFLPLRRTMEMHPAPRAVAIAAMVSDMDRTTFLS